MTMTQHTSDTKPLTLGIIGVGLIGASLGLAHKQAKTFDKVLPYLTVN
jgi:prephenate dehydrogenase